MMTQFTDIYKYGLPGFNELTQELIDPGTSQEPGFMISWLTLMHCLDISAVQSSFLI